MNIRPHSILLAAVLALFSLCSVVTAAPADPIGAQVQAWARDQVSAASVGSGTRIDVEVGALDPRLRLAPCAKIDPYLPSGSRPWGRTRVGLRCVEGPVRWNVYLPVTVRLWAAAPVLREPRQVGHLLTEHDFVAGEADWAAQTEAPIAQPEVMIGRSLARPLAAGQAVHPGDLNRRQWFSAGDVIRVVARGAGYSVSSEGQALTRGLDGESARVRTASGRIVTGTAIGENRVEIPL